MTAEILPIDRQPRPAPRRVVDRPITLTVFPDKFARSKREKVIRFRNIPDAMGKRTAATKGELPWLKFALFGDQPSPKGCYRTNAKSRRQAVAERGYDVAALDTEIAADRARENLLGLNFSMAPSPQTGGN